MMAKIFATGDTLLLNKKNLPIFGTLVSGLVIFAPAHAEDGAGNAGTKILGEVASVATSDDVAGALKGKTLQAAAGTVEEKTKLILSPYFDYVGASAGAGDSLKGSTYEVIAVKAYDNGGMDDGFFFNQLGFNYYDKRKTVNLGFGYRQLLDDKKWMLGANVFYDHEFPNDHQRAGAGLELKSSVFKVAYNQYEGLSGYKADRSGTDSKALSGHDLRLDAVLPYLPGATLGYEKFVWKGDGNAKDLKGHKLSLSGNLSQYLKIDAGRTYYDGNARTDDNWAKLTFQMSFGPSSSSRAPSLFDVADNAYQLTAIDYERYMPVQRENRIVKQKAFAATVTGN